MDTPEIDIQFIENMDENVIKQYLDIYGNSYMVQPATTWTEIPTCTSMIIDYENDLFLTKQLLKRIYKEVFRISGEVIRENFKNTLTQNWFWTSHEELIKLLKRYKTIPDNTVTQASLLQNVQNIPFRDEP